jgi:hypothetical protein
VPGTYGSLVAEPLGTTLLARSAGDLVINVLLSGLTGQKGSWIDRARKHR